MRKIAILIYLYCIYSKIVKNLHMYPLSSCGVMVSALGFYPTDCRFESWSRYDDFNLFFSKMRQKVKKFVSIKPECQKNIFSFGCDCNHLHLIQY